MSSQLQGTPLSSIELLLVASAACSCTLPPHQMKEDMPCLPIPASYSSIQSPFCLRDGLLVLVTTSHPQRASTTGSERNRCEFGTTRSQLCNEGTLRDRR